MREASPNLVKFQDYIALKGHLHRLLWDLVKPVYLIQNSGGRVTEKYLHNQTTTKIYLQPKKTDKATDKNCPNHIWTNILLPVSFVSFVSLSSLSFSSSIIFSDWNLSNQPSIPHLFSLLCYYYYVIIDGFRPQGVWHHIKIIFCLVYCYRSQEPKYQQKSITRSKDLTIN